MRYNKMQTGDKRERPAALRVIFTLRVGLYWLPVIAQFCGLHTAWMLMLTFVKTMSLPIQNTTSALTKEKQQHTLDGALVIIERCNQ